MYMYNIGFYVPCILKKSSIVISRYFVGNYGMMLNIKDVLAIGAECCRKVVLYETL